MSVPPIVAARPVAPDADWEGLRARLMAALTAAAPSTWTDHNAVDPGVTLLEATAFGLADLHYRTAEHRSGWPVEVPAWLAADQRHWHATLPVAGAAALADTLADAAPAGAGPGSTAEALEPRIRACASPGDATSLLARSPWTGVFTATEVPVVIALMRARLVRQVAHERADVVSAAVDAERSGTVAERDARAATELAFWLPLWPEELVAVVRRERRRRTAEAVAERLAAIIAATSGPAVTAVRADLAAQGLTSDEVDLAMGAAPVPPGALPEDFEEADGATRLWPPHPLQSLTCEPVTALDYARRARAHQQVRRAWAVPERLAGFGWDGRPVTASAGKGAVTLVVERVPKPPEISVSAWNAAKDAFLVDVLRRAIGSEVDQPHPTWRDTFDPLDPRRMICDEVGVTLLKTILVTLKGRLVTGVGVDRTATIAGALSRVAAHFAAGRPESRPVPVATPLIDGPWPRNNQPADGWTPGEPIRFTEVVQAIMADPTVLGVQGLAIGLGPNPASSAFVPSSAGTVAIPADCVPQLSPIQCLRVQLALEGECADA